MPELPEVETIARELDEVLKGKVISGAEVLRKSSFVGDEKKLIGKKIKGVDRKAKIIVIDFGGWDRKILIHLKMTGQLVWRKNRRSVAGGHPTGDWLGKLPSKHTRVFVAFEDGSRLFFNDLRVFGWMKIVDRNQWSDMEGKMPPDVIDCKFSLKYFRKVLAKGNRAVKLVIMDQARMGGLGNIYACDGLFMAGIRPERKVSDLKGGEIKRLHKAIKKVIGLGIKYKGATYSDFVSSRGVGGKYQEHFLVYGRNGETCRKCRQKIKKTKLGGRGTYFCAKCQA